MALTDIIKEVKVENPLWKSKSRIVGRAGEIYCRKHLNCLKCNSTDWYESAVNEKSTDQICTRCKKISNQVQKNNCKTIY